MTTKKKIIHQLPNTCTLINALCGLVALMISVFYKSPKVVNISCALILVGAFFDTIDGRLARRLKISSEMGKQLDSFADLITFGITPICVFLTVHSIGNLNKITLPEIIISAIYISCVIYRLARYNISNYTNYFEGLPSTASGMFMSLYTFISNLTIHMWSQSISYTIISYAIIIFLGIAMVSKVRINRI